MVVNRGINVSLPGAHGTKGLSEKIGRSLLSIPFAP